jgi:hypothetical protein
MQVKLSLRAALLGAALVASAAIAPAASATAITYNVDQTIGLGSVVGTIQTDGAIGTLGASDITAWDLHLNGVGATFEITNSNSAVFLRGDDVTASASDLFFNYSGTDNGLLLFQQGLFSGNFYYCDSTASDECFQGATVTPGFVFDGTAQNVALSGNQIIGTAVPEPATWAMVLVGFGGLGVAMRARRRQAAATA